MTSYDRLGQSDGNQRSHRCERIYSRLDMRKMHGEKTTEHDAHKKISRTVVAIFLKDAAEESAMEMTSHFKPASVNAACPSVAR
jgi:DNA transposition AAA+ family ATPase